MPDRSISADRWIYEYSSRMTNYRCNSVSFDRKCGSENEIAETQGLADSGGSAKMMVADGAVSVDGRIETRKTCKIRAGQVVLLGDTRIAVHEA